MIFNSHQQSIHRL